MIMKKQKENQNIKPILIAYVICSFQPQTYIAASYHPIKHPNRKSTSKVNYLYNNQTKQL